jgi:hypothetical protein
MTTFQIILSVIRPHWFIRYRVPEEHLAYGMIHIRQRRFTFPLGFTPTKKSGRVQLYGLVGTDVRNTRHPVPELVAAAGASHRLAEAHLDDADQTISVVAKTNLSQRPDVLRREVESLALDFIAVLNNYDLWEALRISGARICGFPDDIFRDDADEGEGKDDEDSR